jgi:hypothetical protein
VTSADADADGHDAIECGGDDCDDADAMRHPGATEVCDAANVDEDCDPHTVGILDADGDGSVSSTCCNVAIDGVRICGDDCDDGAPSRRPGAPELCDGHDDDCDGAVDEAGSSLLCMLPHSSVATCTSGACAVTTCDAGRGDCNASPLDGCERDLGSDPRNCGACGVVCGASACVAGRCRPGADRVVTVDAGEYHTCAGYASGRVRCWGANAEGQLGDGTTTDRHSAVDAIGLYDVSSIGAGGGVGGTTCFARTGGPMRCTGALRGDGEAGGTTVPLDARLPADAAVVGVDVAMGLTFYHACLWSLDGRAWCWGDIDASGGAPLVSNAPVLIPGATSVVGAATNQNHSCVVQAAGTVLCWGNNLSGQCGTGTFGGSYATPQLVVGLTDAVRLMPTYDGTCALRSGGQLVCWGLDMSGQFGTGAHVHSATPVASTPIPDLQSVAFGEQVGCAIRTNGHVICWGEVMRGELGDGTTGYVSRLRPAAEVTGITDAVQISAGRDHVCVVRASGGVSCWGDNGYGQLGDGTTTPRPRPVAVLGL